MVTDAEHVPLSDLAIPPGELLKEELAAAGITPRQLSRLLKLPPRLVRDILQGNQPVTREIAHGLEDALGVSAHLWMNLQTQYQLTIAGAQDRSAPPDRVSSIDEPGRNKPA